MNIILLTLAMVVSVGLFIVATTVVLIQIDKFRQRVPVSQEKKLYEELSKVYNDVDIQRYMNHHQFKKTPTLSKKGR